METNLYSKIENLKDTKIEFIFSRKRSIKAIRFTTIDSFAFTTSNTMVRNPNINEILHYEEHFVDAINKAIDEKNQYNLRKEEAAKKEEENKLRLLRQDEFMLKNGLSYNYSSLMRILDEGIELDSDFILSFEYGYEDTSWELEGNDYFKAFFIDKHKFTMSRNLTGSNYDESYLEYTNDKYILIYGVTETQDDDYNWTDFITFELMSKS